MASENTLTKSTRPAEKSDTAHNLFERLPREIRDQIYYLISQDKEELIGKDGHSTLFFRIRTTIPKVRLLNNFFKEEYDARPLVDNHLQVSECISTSGMTYGFFPILSVEKTKSFPPEIRD
jgi:hypothetical protein